jgi:hypothetical protein
MIDMSEAAAPADEKLIPRETPEPSEARSALVNRWTKDIQEAKKHWKKDFERMRRNMEFAYGKQWPGQTDNDGRYVANLAQRVIKTSVASLYAKNPTVVYQRRRKLDFTLWDGKQETAQAALQAVQMAQGAAATVAAGGQAIAPNPALTAQAQQLLADIASGTQRREMMDKLGKTLVALSEYYMQEDVVGFRNSMKRMVTRTRTTGVGYVKLGFQRKMDLSEEQSRKIADMSERLAVIGRLQADISDGETDPDAPEAEQLRLAIQAIQNEPDFIIREGVVFEFPHSTRIIPSVSTEKLMGWVGADWVTEEIMMTPARIREVYGVDVAKGYTAYRVTGGTPQAANYVRQGGGRDGLACVWHVYEKSTGLEFVLCEGHKDFLKEPASPSIFIEQFFPFFAVTFNDVENEAELFPKSDVENLKHIQMEYNRSKEARRQHRIANRPLYLAPSGTFEEDEEKSLEDYPAHSVISINALKDGMKSSDILVPVQKIGVDPNLYEVQDLFADMTYVTGNQEATLGGISHGTATETNIAEGSRQGTIALDGDDLDEMLTALFRAAGHVMLLELSEETVKGIAGPGAVWPNLSRREVMEELWLEVKAGSSGRPDQARDAAKFERLYPLLVQVPGISPRWLAEKAVALADDTVDIEEAFIEGLPSILMMNRATQAATGNPANDPGQQGHEGADKTRAPGVGGTAQPGYPVGAPAAA